MVYKHNIFYFYFMFINYRIFIDNLLCSTAKLKMAVLTSVQGVYIFFTQICVLHCAIFRASCHAMTLRDKLHDALHRVTYLAM